MTNPEAIMQATEQYFYLKPGDMINRNRQKTTANARAVSQYIIRSLCDLSYSEIAEIFERDHSTVIHNCNKIVKLIQNSRDHNLSCATINIMQKFI